LRNDAAFCVFVAAAYDRITVLKQGRRPESSRRERGIDFAVGCRLLCGGVQPSARLLGHRAVRSEPRQPAANRGPLTFAIMLANIMQGLDTTIANVALPHIRGSLSASLDQISWVLTSYIVAAAIMMPLTGWLAGRFGIKIVFIISVAGFTVASALCGSATSLGELVLYRGLQGICGAGLVPLSQAVLLQINPPEQHGQAMAVFGIGTILGPICGPVLGGWLTYDYNWRWVFYINLPVGVIAALGMLIFGRESRHAHREPFDLLGFVTLSMAIGALQMLLDRGELKDWFGSTEIWVEAALCGVAFYLFVVHTATATDRSFLNRDLLKNLNFTVGTVLMFMVGLIMNGTLALLPTMLQDLMNYPVLTTGLVTAPRGVGSMIAMFVVARLINRVDNRLIILFGLLLTAVSMWQMTEFSLAMGMQPIIISGLVQGFGLGCTFVPLNTIALSNLPRHILTQGTALRSLMRNLGGSIGIAVLEALLTENTQIVHSRLVEQLRPDNPLARAPYLAAPYSLTTPPGIAALNAEVTRQAAMVAYINDFALMMMIAIGSVFLLLLIRPTRSEGSAPILDGAMRPRRAG
jgi:MFS transporter, DHA2 family, multidrug resistance protein